MLFRSGSSALDISDAFDRIRATRISINYATLVGHNTIRESVMGTTNRLPRMDELHRMKSLVFKAPEITRPPYDTASNTRWPVAPVTVGAFT